MDFSPSEVESTIVARLRRIVESWPDRPAVRAHTSEITFAELEVQSDRIARNILQRRGPASEPIATLIRSGIDTAIGQFGILKTGKSIVSFFPDGERPVLAGLWDYSLRPPILSDGMSRPLAASLTRSEDEIIDWEDDPSTPAPPAPNPISPDTPACLLYTSGTTGVPKGVILTHRMLLDSAFHYRNFHQYSERDRFSYLSARNSSAATAVGLYIPLCGTTLVIPPEKEDKSLPFLDWLQEERITVMSITAINLFLQYLRAYGRRPSLPDLRKINLSGADFLREDLEEIREKLPSSVEFVYRLASTDLNQICELRIPPAGSTIPWEKIPVGRAVPGREILLLNENRQPVPAGEIGEIAVRSRFLPSGYWRQPELTARRFLPDPDGGDRRILLTGDMGRLLPDGMLEYIGRTDNLVRIQGQNVHLEEVEKYLRQMPGVREGVVQIVSWAAGEKRLTAYLVPEVGSTLSVDRIRRNLNGVIPLPMIPTLYVILDSLPRLPTGKVDRSALPPPTTARPPLSTPYREPRTAVEEKLCAIWQEILHMEPVGADDDFFDLGGDSLLVLTMTLAVEQEFHRAIPSAFFRAVSVAALADLWLKEDRGELREDNDTLILRAARGKGNKRKMARSADFDGRKIVKARLKSNPGISLASFVVSHLPYESGVRWAALTCRFPPMRSLYLQRHIRLFQSFRTALGGCPDAPADAELISLVGNLLWSSRLRAGMGELSDFNSLEGMHRSPARFWRDLAHILDDGPQDVFDRLFHAYGLDHLEHAYAAGKGVVLVTLHSTSSRAASAGIRRLLRSQPIQTISHKRAQSIDRLRFEEEEPQDSRPDNVTLSTDLMMKGYQSLKEGQIIQLVPDGRAFSIRDNPVSISGRSTYIQSGFAKIALLADAPIIPLLTTRRLDGSVHFTFFPPLVPRDMQAPLERKIADLVKQYAAFLERSWKSAPESVPWTKMDDYLRWPASG